MKNKSIRIIYISLFLFLILPCHAIGIDQGSIHFRRVSVEDGLSQNTISALTQDLNNKIWVGTGDGLNWYDGTRIVTFYKDLNDTTSIANNQIRSLCTDSHGTVWVGTAIGLSKYNMIGNNFSNYYYPENRLMEVFDLVDLESKNQLLLATSAGLILFEKETGRMEQLPFVNGARILSVCRAHNGVLLGTSKGVFLYHPDTQDVMPAVTALEHEAIVDIVYDGQSRTCWFATYNNGLFYADDRMQIRKHYTFQNTAGLLTSNDIRVMSYDRYGKLWVATADDLLLFDPVSGSFTKCSTARKETDLPGYDTACSFLNDSQGGFWIGTYYGGLNYYHPLAPAFGVLNYKANGNSLSDNVVSCIVEDPESRNLWIGTNNGGLNHYDRKKQLFTGYSTTSPASHALLSNNIRCVLPGEDALLYIGTQGGGLSCLNRKTKTMTHYSIPSLFSMDNSCYALLPDSNAIWVGTGAGIYLFDKQTRRFAAHAVCGMEPRLKDIRIQTLFRDSKGRVWIGSEKSLFLYTPAGELKELRYAVSDISPGFIPALNVAEDHSGTIWVAAASGLYRYNEIPDSFKHYSTDDGLPNNHIYGILEDQQARLWLTTNKGLSCFDKEKNSFINYTTQDGLSHNQFNYSGVCKAQDGTFFLGTLAGITCFCPGDFVENPFAPAPVISGAAILSKPITHIKNEESHFFQAEDGTMIGFSFLSNLKLFNIRFTVINYLAGKRSQFAYKLEGFDKDWIHISQYVSLRGATYSNLDPGRYVFKVKACNNSGQWCETPTEFFVDIVPMWYQTWWFKLLITIGVAGMVFWAVYFFLLRTRMRMQMQVEQMERQKIEELSQEKVRFYTNISHELRTPLTLILAPLEEIAGKSRFLDKHIQEKLAYVYRNTQKLLLIVNQSLDLHKADSGTLPVQVAYRNVDEIAWNIFSAFQEKADRHGIKYHFQSNLNESLLPVDQMYLETILMNLLSNAFKFTPDNRVIELILEKEPEAWSICVKDQGIGISAEKQKRIFERFYQAGQDHPGSGIGLSLVRCLVDKHHGVVSVKSSECVGTAFKVVFPDNIDAFSKDEKAIEEAAAPVGDKISEPLFADPLPDSFVQQVSPATDPETPAETILVVDDNVEMTAYLKANFRSRYVTLTAGNGEEAMQILKLHKVDVIVSDVMMPVMDGIRLCELVKRNFQTCHIPVILLSAKGSVDAQNKGVHVGADDYIAKPFSISLLNGKIRNILKAKERLIHHYCNTINIDTAKMTSNVLDEEFIRKAMKIINENLDNENFTADELAQKLYISRSTLYLKMNSISGESPAGFIRRIRLNTACRLLLEGRYGISEISTMVGFNSPAYFSSSFKKNIGCLPSEYVKKQQEPSCITE